MSIRHRGSSPFSLALLLSINELAYMAVAVLAIIAAGLYLRQQELKRLVTDHLYSADVRSADEQQFSLLVTNYTPALYQNLITVVSNKADDLKMLSLSTNGTQTLILTVSLPKTFIKLKDEADNLEKGIRDSTTKNGQLAREVTRLNDVVKGLREDLQDARDKAKQTDQALKDSETATGRAKSELAEEKQSRAAEAAFRKELLGLRGQMRNVALVIDLSESMTEGERWPATKATIKTWIEYLPLEKCAIICFNNRVFWFPAGIEPELLTVVDSPVGRANRKRISEFLEKQEPNGFTDTPQALQKAYTIKGVDTIILFTDGRPATETEVKFDKRLERKTYALVREAQREKARPINVVGVGNYFEREFGNYLETLANLTGGTFIGR